MINSVVMMGRLTADPEIRRTQSDIDYCRFSIAVERPYKRGEEKKTDFFNCVAWRSTADFLGRYFKRGQMVAITGSLQTGSFTNKDGDTVKTCDINVSTVSFCGSKSGDRDDRDDRRDRRDYRDDRDDRRDRRDYRDDRDDRRDRRDHRDDRDDRRDRRDYRDDRDDRRSGSRSGYTDDEDLPF